MSTATSEPQYEADASMDGPVKGLHGIRKAIPEVVEIEQFAVELPKDSSQPVLGDG
jgi:hypothetical protein